MGRGWLDDETDAVANTKGLQTGSAHIQLVPHLHSTYSNSVVCVRMAHELFVDFFVTEPLGISEGRGTHVARIALPVSLVPDFARILAEHAEGLEAAAAEAESRISSEPDRSAS